MITYELINEHFIDDLLGPTGLVLSDLVVFAKSVSGRSEINYVCLLNHEFGILFSEFLVEIPKYLEGKTNKCTEILTSEFRLHIHFKLKYHDLTYPQVSYLNFDFQIFFSILTPRKR